MESKPCTDPNSIIFIPRQDIKIEKLKYINYSKEVYVNLFEIFLSKEINLFQYPYSVEPEIESGDIRIRNKIFKKVHRELNSIYGECCISGDSLYGVKKFEETKMVKCNIFLNGNIQYKLTFQPVAQKRTINQNDIHKDELSKQFIEILIRDILHCNPKLDFYKGYFIYKKVKNINSQNSSFDFYPGYMISFMETEGGNFLNVTIKNKITSSYNFLEYLEYYGYKSKNEQKNIKKRFIGQSFKVSYAKRNYRIDDINFDRNPTNYFKNNEGKNVTFVEYYKTAHNLKITNLTQPLIEVKKKGPQGEEKSLFFIPELCFLNGLDDDATKDRDFMSMLAQETKLEPDDRIEKTNKFLELLNDDTKDEEHGNLSAKEKSKKYGIEVKPLKKKFKAYYMKDTELIAGNSKKLGKTEKTPPALIKKDMTKWVCFYDRQNYHDAGSLSNSLIKASKSYGFNIKEPTWKEMPENSTEEDWINAAEQIFKKKNNFGFALFLLGENDYIYPQLKWHSLCEIGYISQVVRVKSIKKKGALSVCSKILIQINAKLGGVLYQAKIGKEVEDRKLMIIGVDSSHIKGQKTGIAMVATINNSFTNFYNKEIIIENDKRDQFFYSISSFIDEALVSYRDKNKELPKGIIIYRQGVSLQQKEFLKSEISYINDKCIEKKLLYYYILVNTKTTYKFFEEGNKRYNNPEPGLLILDGVTNRNYFEFYIQPQEVTGGSATPTCFHVAYGNMNLPEMIPRLTYDLCHIYSNWQGAVRVPNVIKAAEKLSKMTAKYTLEELNPSLKLGQPYL